MALGNNFRDEITQRQFTEHEWEVDMFERQANLQLKLKELDIEASKLEAKIVSWFRIPLVLITLPVRILFVIPFCIYVAKGKDIPEQFWALLR